MHYAKTRVNEKSSYSWSIIWNRKRTCEIADWAFNYFEKQTFGHLVAISSIAGLRGSRQAPAYNATKAFQINYLEGLRHF